jgi:hypothetical protein
MAPGMKFMIAFTDDDSVPPALTGASIYWRDLSDIREPTDWRAGTLEYRRRRQAYQMHLEGRDAHLALASALQFLIAEVKARGIEIPEAD